MTIIRIEIDGDDLPEKEKVAVDKIHTVDLLERLNRLDDAPWGDLRGKELDARRLSKMLRQYEVRPDDQRIGEVTKKGYDRICFYDSWQRYLPPLPSESSATSATTAANGPDVADVAHTPGGDR